MKYYVTGIKVHIQSCTMGNWVFSSNIINKLLPKSFFKQYMNWGKDNNWSGIDNINGYYY